MRSSVRWVVPLAVTAAIGSGAAMTSASAGDPPSVTSRTPQQVLALVAGSKVTALSGTVQTRTALGLPDVSGVQRLGGSGRSSTGTSAAAVDVQGLVTRFLTGENTLRLWVDGPTHERTQLLDPFQELDLVRDGDALWTYSSKDNAVGKATLSGADHATDSTKTDSTKTDSATADPTKQVPTPDALAKDALTRLDPTTTVSLDTPATVAGRATYSLVLTPKTSATLVQRVVVNVDAENGVPLRVGVYARGQGDAAILSAFTSVDYATPAASIFRFTPPKGASVTDLASAMPSATGSSGQADAAAGSSRTVVHGAGWAAIVESRSPVPLGLLDGAASSSSTSLLRQLTTPVSGGRAVRSSLFSVLLTDDGRVLAGAVPVQALVEQSNK